MDNLKHDWGMEVVLPFGFSFSKITQPLRAEQGIFKVLGDIFVALHCYKSVSNHNFLRLFFS